MDNVDCLFRSACGSGKTGVLALIALCITKIGLNPDIVPMSCRSSFPKNPVILVICPTDALEIDLECKLKRYKINAVAINSNLCAKAARKEERNLWDIAKSSDVILLAPEQLEGRGLTEALSDAQFRQRIYLLVVDEVHLVDQWSKSFRKAYGRIGDARNRLGDNTRLLLLTATLREGGPYDLILKKFDLIPGRFLDLHRSNLRPEVRVTTTILPSSPNSAFTFPFLSWVVGLQGISIIFTRNRTLTLKIALYLMQTNPEYTHKIRKCDSTNDPDEYDAETYRMTKVDILSGLVLVSTSVLTLGMDIPNVRRVITLEPTEFEQEIQEEGRVLRQRSKNDIAEAYAYFSQATYDLAVKMVEEDQTEPRTGNRKQKADVTADSKKP
ncbi:P-loop containing nucleoside triphosphate hydrolase protein, partial [Lentinula raphanica]